MTVEQKTISVCIHWFGLQVKKKNVKFSPKRMVALTITYILFNWYRECNISHTVSWSFRSSSPIFNLLTPYISIYRIGSLTHCVTNISYWLPLNEGFRCNCMKTNKYVIFVLCVSDQVKCSICDVIFACKEKGEITLLLTVH